MIRQDRTRRSLQKTKSITFQTYREALTCHCCITISAQHNYSWINYFILKVCFCPLLATTQSFVQVLLDIWYLSYQYTLSPNWFWTAFWWMCHKTIAFSNTLTISLFFLRIINYHIKLKSSETHTTRAWTSINLRNAAFHENICTLSAFHWAPSCPQMLR